MVEAVWNGFFRQRQSAKRGQCEGWPVVSFLRKAMRSRNLQQGLATFWRGLLQPDFASDIDNGWMECDGLIPR